MPLAPSTSTATITPKTNICGIVMPISTIDGCSESHWSDVLEILSDAIEDSGFEPNLVSNADDIGIIHKRIIQNLYDNPVVVCDVSGKNPNVMFELGLRLAFDKATVIVKDDKTSYSFDTSAIEHIEYPRDLRFTKIVEFKSKLTEKIAGTYAKAQADPEFSTFLKHFGEFKIAKIDQKEVSGQEFLEEELRNIRTAILRLERSQSTRSQRARGDINLCLKSRQPKELPELLRAALEMPDVKEAWLERTGEHNHLFIRAADGQKLSRGDIQLRLGIPQAGSSSPADENHE
jgi:hypothetical protein